MATAQMEELAGFAASKGWIFHGAAAVRTLPGGLSAGASVSARKHLCMEVLPDLSPSQLGRTAALQINSSRRGLMLVSSFYGVVASARETLVLLGEVIRSLSCIGKMWMSFGDFNMAPHIVATHLAAASFPGVVVAPTEPICAQALSFSVLNFSVVHPA